LCVIIGGSGVGYVWQKSQINELGRQIKQREQKLIELDHQNKKLRDHLAELRSPAKLNERVQKLNLGLVLPQANQVWLLPEPVVMPPTLRSPGQVIAESSQAGLAMH